MVASTGTPDFLALSNTSKRPASATRPGSSGNLAVCYFLLVLNEVIANHVTDGPANDSHTLSVGPLTLNHKTVVSNPLSLKLSAHWRRSDSKQSNNKDY